MDLATSLASELYLDLLIKTLCAWVYPESGWRWHSQAMVDGKLLSMQKDALFVKLTPFDPAVRIEGRDWPLFGYSMIGKRRLENVRRCVEDVLRNDVPGDLMEAGVWRGGAAMLMRGILKLYDIADRKVWVADSFEGMPKPGAIEKQVMPRQPNLEKHPYMIATLPEVQANFRRFDLLDDQVKFVKGWFNESLPKLETGPLAVLRVDCDLYQSTMDVLTNLYDKVSPGGFVIIDDYNDWESAKAATDEFRAARNITAEIKRIDWSGVYWQVPR